MLAEPAISKLPKDLCWDKTALTHLNFSQSLMTGMAGSCSLPASWLCRGFLAGDISCLVVCPQARGPQASSSSQSRGQFTFEISVHLISLCMRCC